MRWTGRLIYLAAFFLLSGCVAGQSINMGYEPTPMSGQKLGIAVQVSCDDQRPFVVSGDKQGNHIGHYRAGFGNPWDVTTQNKQPLADNLRRDIASDLTSLGFEIVDKDAARVLKIIIQDWNFDAYINGKIWYSVLVTVDSADGKQLAGSKIAKRTNIKGSFWVGAKYAFEREIPKIYQSVVNQIAKDNPPIGF